MQLSLAHSTSSYASLIVLIVCVLALGFMLWFLAGMTGDFREAHRKRLSSYQRELALWVYIPAHDESGADFEKEARYARYFLDSRNDRFLRRVYRLRPLLRPREVTIPRLRKLV